MLGLFGPKSGKIGVYKAALIYQGPFKEDFSAGSPAINEVVLKGGFSEVSEVSEACAATQSSQGCLAANGAR